MKRGLLLFLLALPITFQLAAGCGLQGEGERCDVKNTVDGVSGDCATGLNCVPAGQLNGAQTDLCCLPTGSTNEACIGGGASSSSSSGASSSSSSGASSSASTGTGGTGGTGGMGGGGMGGAGGGDAG